MIREKSGCLHYCSGSLLFHCCFHGHLATRSGSLGYCCPGRPVSQPHMCVYMYMRMYIYIYTHILCVYIYIYICIHIYSPEADANGARGEAPTAGTTAKARRSFARRRITCPLRSFFPLSAPVSSYLSHLYLFHSPSGPISVLP